MFKVIHVNAHNNVTKTPYRVITKSKNKTNNVKKNKLFVLQLVDDHETNFPNLKVFKLVHVSKKCNTPEIESFVCHVNQCIRANVLHFIEQSIAEKKQPRVFQFGLLGIVGKALKSGSKLLKVAKKGVRSASKFAKKGSRIAQKFAKKGARAARKYAKKGKSYVQKQLTKHGRSIKKQVNALRKDIIRGNQSSGGGGGDVDDYEYGSDASYPDEYPYEYQDDVDGVSSEMADNVLQFEINQVES